MKTLNTIFRLNVLFFVLFTASCAQSTENILPSTSTSTLQTSSTSVPTNIANTSTIPSALAVIPTMPVEDARNRLIALLLDNGDCLLPCLWGITPGTSTYHDAQSILMPLSILSERTNFLPKGGAVSLKYIEANLTLGAFATFNVDALSNNHIVSDIGLSARAVEKLNNEFLVAFNSDFFKEHLEYYMLPHILTEYGNPTTVMLSTMAKLPSSDVPGGFKILFLYPDRGILIN